MNATVKTLQILKGISNARPAQFAYLYFPKDHDGWKRSGRCGANGSTKGQGLVLWAGGWLGKLRKKGLLNSRNEVTDAGLEYLRKHS